MKENFLSYACVFSFSKLLCKQGTEVSFKLITENKHFPFWAFYLFFYFCKSKMQNKAIPLLSIITNIGLLFLFSCFHFEVFWFLGACFTSHAHMLLWPLWSFWFCYSCGPSTAPAQSPLPRTESTTYWSYILGYIINGSEFQFPHL